MSFWVFLMAAALTAAGAMALIAMPLLRRRGGRHEAGTADALCRRLAEIASNRESGLIGEESAAEAEVEAKRAALRATAPGERPETRARRLRLGAIAFLATAPLAAAGIYLTVGAPALIDPPPVAAADDIAALPEDERRAMIEQMVAGLAARLEIEPGDAEGWRMLARSQMVLDRAADSAASYRRLLTLEEGALDDWRNYATALAAVTPDQRFPTAPEFRRALGEIERRAPGDMMALFYRGGAARQAGDAAGAAAIWRTLLAEMPADAPVRASLEDLIAEAEQAALSKAVPK